MTFPFLHTGTQDELRGRAKGGLRASKTLVISVDI